ncbi:hypothetical protein A4U61_24210 [Streptomyces sp. H-KF8]|nr:hypothetical protein A4U61_24210 [Streptomyces sp. H-KF8]
MARLRLGRSTAYDLIRSRRLVSITVGRNRHFYPIRERLGLEVRFHDLRHTCVTLLLGLGIPPHIVRDIVGHSALGVTMNIYAHADMTEKRAALDRLGSLLTAE